MKRKLFFITLLMLFCSTVFGQYWGEPKKLQCNMTLNANIKIDGHIQNSDELEIAAFCGSELRGTTTSTIEDGESNVFFTIQGNNSGEKISFKLYVPDEDGGKVLGTDELLVFYDDAMVGFEPLLYINFYEKHWDYVGNPQNTMTLECIIAIDGIVQQREDLELAAFCGDELRGVAKPKSYEIGSNQYVYLSTLVIAGENNESISFKLYDPTLDEDNDELETDYKVTFVKDATLGNEERLTIEFKNNPVARIGEEGNAARYFSTLEAALNAADDNDVISLLKEVNVTTKFTTTKNITLDLNDNTLTLSTGGNMINSNVTIQNGNLAIADVDTQTTGNSNCFISTDVGASLTLDDIVMTGDGYTTHWAVLCAMSNSTAGGSTINITNSTITLSNEKGSKGGFIKDQSGVDNYSQVNISKSTLTLYNVSRGFTGAKVTLDEVGLTITGGEHGINGSELEIKNGSNVSISKGTGRAITLNKFNASIAGSTVTIADMGEGGIRYKTANTLTVYENSTLSETKAHADVKGAMLNDKEVKGTENDMSTVKVENGVTTVINPVYVAMIGETEYKTLQAAIDAATEGQTVIVIGDIVLEENDGIVVAEGKNIILDLNGKTISQVKAQTTEHSMLVNLGVLTIEDSSVDESGKISYTDNGNGGEYVSNTISNYNTLTINGGTIENLSSQALASAGYPHAIDNNLYYNKKNVERDVKLVINGGTISNEYYSAIRLFCNSTVYENITEINGGTIVNAIDFQLPNANKLLGRLTITAGEFEIKNGKTASVRMFAAGNANDGSGMIASIKGGNFKGSIGGISVLPVPASYNTKIITGGTFTTDVTDYCAPGFACTQNAQGTFSVTFADYITLPTGVTVENYEEKFGTNTVTDGTNYYATMKAALDGIHKTNINILYCKPGADLGTMTHGHVCSNLTVYGNDAFVSGGEYDFEVDTYDNTTHNYDCDGITSEMTLTINYLHKVAVWGQRRSENTINITLNNCKDINRVYISGTSGDNNINLNNCTATAENAAPCVLYSNANGTINVADCSFTNVKEAVNLNHKVAGEQIVYIKNTTFYGVGNSAANYAAPVRVLSSVEGAQSNVSVANCSFANTVANSLGQNADILLDYGVGLTTATVSNTAANVVVEREDNVAETTAVAADETKSFNNKPYVAKIGEQNFTTIAEALAATEDNAIVTIIASTNETIDVPAGNNVTITAAEGVVLSGGVGGSYYNKSVTFDGLTFKGGKGMALTASVEGLTYTVKNCTFDGVQATAWKQGVISLNGNATVVIESNIITYVQNATEGDDRIESQGQQSTGIYTSGSVELTITGNTISNVDGTGISANNNAGKVTITDNTISNWGTGATAKNEGRAIRTSGGTEVAINRNVMIDNGTAKEEFVKATEVTTSINVSENYWDGNNPLSEGIFDTNFADDPAIILYSYYADENKEELVILLPSVAKIGEEYYRTFEEAIAAVEDGQTIDILQDVVLQGYVSFTKDITFTINGNGKTIKPSENSTETNSAFNFGQGGNNTIATRNYTLKNIVFDGWTTDHVVRLQGVTATVEGCTFQNCNQLDGLGLGLLTLTFCESVVKNCKFMENSCVKAIDINSWGDDSDGKTIIEGCTFYKNTCNTTAVVYYNNGESCRLHNNMFLANVVKCNNNGATVYLGFTENNVVTNNLFNSNKVIDASESTRVAGAIFFGYEAKVEANAFINNKASNKNGTEGIAQDVCTSIRENCVIELSGNYWFDGIAPVAGVNYTIQHQDGEGVVVLGSYYKNANVEMDEDGAHHHIIVSDLEVLPVAKVNETEYPSLATAAEAANGAEITILRNFIETYEVAEGTTVNVDMGTNTLVGTILAPNADLTINGGIIRNTDSTKSGIQVNAGELTLNDVEITSARHALRLEGTNGVVVATINGGTYKLHEVASQTQHVLNAGGDGSQVTVLISGGTFVGPRGTSSDSGAAVNAQTNAIVTIEGGDFSGGKNNTLSSKGTLTVKGGTYDQDPSAYLATGYLCGFNQENQRYEVTMGVASLTQNETTTYYATLAEAIAEIGAGDVVINLHANVTLNYDAREAYGTAETTSVTINGNGNILAIHQTNTDWSSLGLVNEDAKFVFIKMTINKTKAGGNNSWNNYAIIFSSEVEMTNVIVNNSMAVQNGATLNNVTINEANGYYGLWINGNGQSVTMNGGSINATNGGRGIKVADEYVDDVKQVTLKVTGTTFNTAKKAAVLVSSTKGAKVTANVCDITNVAEDNVNFVWVDEDWAAYYNEVKVYDDATKTQENEESFPIKVWYVNGDGVKSSIRAYYTTLDALFAAPATQVPGSNYIDLRGNVVAENKVDVNYGSNRVYTFGTEVEGGVTMEFKYAENWNMLPKFDLGQNITLNVPYLQVIGGDISIAGTLNTGHLYLYGTGEGVVIEETGVVNANVSNDKTVQVKGGTVLTVKGKLNTSTLNVWTQDVNNSKLIVSGTGASVTASHIHAWNENDGVSSQEIVVENGATLTAENLQADRGSIVTVDAATLTATQLTLGYEGNIGTLVVQNNGVVTNGVVISSIGSTVTGPETLTVTSGVEGYGVNYYDGVYSLVVIETQKTELYQGWNWFSSYIDINGEEGLEKLQDSLGGNATLMKSHTAFGAYSEGNWYNNGGAGLNAASVTEMYMIDMVNDFTLQLEGNSVNPEEHPIQLAQYWNWIGYPLNVSADLATAFGTTPQHGDQIKSHVGFSQYYGEGTNDFGITGWWGTLSTMTPGLGYMYYRNDEATSFTYTVPAEGAKSELRANITAENNYWVPTSYQYANNMTMIAMMEGLNDGNYEIAAFINGEVRGSARPIYVEPLDAYMFFLTIHGDEVEEMTFRCYDLATGEEYAISDRINYSVNAMLGSIEEPYILRGTVGISENAAAEINIYPNPTTTGREINLETICETVEVYNALGVKIAEYHNVDTIDALETAGIYVIRVTIDGNARNYRLVVK